MKTDSSKVSEGKGEKEIKDNESIRSERRRIDDWSSSEDSDDLEDQTTDESEAGLE